MNSETVACVEGRIVNYTYICCVKCVGDVFTNCSVKYVGDIFTKSVVMCVIQRSHRIGCVLKELPL